MRLRLDSRGLHRFALSLNGDHQIRAKLKRVLPDVFVVDARLLRKAANAANHPTRAARMGTPGIEIYVWYVGLESPELHIARVKSRVARGGHNISEDDIRRRYERSRLNLIDLLPVLRALRMFDNTSEADPAGGQTPKPILVLSMERGKILRPKDLTHTPAWAKPIVAAALRLTRKR
ncbi:MAG: ZTL protein [Acidobacteriota bacterium]|nr:ZTL protein [Acidobacteriota bacterium]